MELLVSLAMILYLGGITRPNISYDAHRYAIFSHLPKQSNEVGVKHIVRCLKGTRTEGLIM